MTAALLILLDLLLALGAALRLTRFIVADDVPGQWFIKDPLDRWLHGERRMAAYEAEHLRWQEREYHRTESDPSDPQPVAPPAPRRLKWHRYLEGLGCPFCMSVYTSAAVTLALFLAGGPGDAADWWRYVAGFLTLAWATGHIAARVGDTED